MKMRFSLWQNLWPGWEQAASAARWEILPLLPREGTDSRGGSFSWCHFTADQGPGCQQQMFWHWFRLFTGSWVGSAEQPHSKHPNNFYLRIFQLQISAIPQTSGILGCASWWGWDALDLQAPPAESCLKLSQFENSILEADKNSARFHTVPVEAGGTDGSLQAASSAVIQNLSEF